MLGQADFSLIPAYFMDNIALQYGSNSASWGSGAVGGAVILENKSIFNQGWQADWNSTIASFGNFFNGLSTNYSNQRIESGTKVFYQAGKNNFPIENAQAKNLPHSQISKWGILQKNGFKIKDNQQLDFNLWYQTADRNLPPNLVQQKSVAKQEDESFRGVINYQLSDNQSVISIRSALFYEQLFFQDAIADIDSRSRIWTSSNEIEWTKTFSTQHSINIGGNYSYLKAISNNYNKGNPTENRIAVFAMYQWESVSKNWQTQLSLRQEWINNKRTPFIPAIGFEGKLLKQLLLRGNISRSYRNPTFNDLFWQISGQKDLLSEDGWNQELGLNYALNKQWKFSTTAYNRVIDNWIIWLPKNSIWIPQNLKKVWSRGIESTLNLQQQYNAVKVHLSLNYDLTFSTNQKGTSTQDASIGKQLIYVPKHKLNASLQIEWKDWRLAFLSSIYR